MPRRKRTKAVGAFTENFNKILRERGLTVKQAAELMQLPYTTVVGFTNGAMPSSYESVSKFCTALSLDFEWLLTGKTKNFDPSQIPLDQIFQEEATNSFSGIFKIEAKKLIPIGHKKKGQP